MFKLKRQIEEIAFSLTCYIYFKLGLMPRKTLSVMGSVLATSGNEILLRLGGLLNDEGQMWIPCPKNLPYWVLNGEYFYAQLDENIEYFEQIKSNPLALTMFQGSKTKNLSKDQLKRKLMRMVTKNE